ncbi:archaea-specific SMC-related protein [Salinirubrum litoreum]|uniref:Archaea-specific SMC-related protein n=1 Tax=Salinirubrum litoreum TaxID=1126234 RepID=A0ABD5RGT6_9EURY|nr:archaea-specific SMC-related protein [Salinirubrum litoreum]
MTGPELSDGHVRLTARNIGGIEETSVSLTPGVNVLTGRNATNRTSFLRAIMGALGSDGVSLKADAADGEVSLSVAGETYTRRLRRENGSVVTSGDGYLADPELADLFAFLLETNEARQAVVRDEDLRAVLMRPVDTEAIRAEIATLQSDKRDVEARLEELDDLKRDLPTLENRRSTLESEIVDRREALDAKEREIEAANTGVEESRSKQATLDDRLDDLTEARSDLESVRFRIGSQEESLEALRTELDELEGSDPDLTTADAADVTAVETEIDDLRSRQQRLDATVTELQSIVSFNEEMLDGDSDLLDDSLDRETDTEGAVTDRLVGTDALVCWTCGTTVERTAIEETVERLRTLRRELLDERGDVTDRLRDRQMERDRLTEQRKRRRELERRHDQLVAEIDEREAQLASLRDRRAELSDTVERLEAAVDEIPEQDYSEVLALHKEANRLEFEIQQLTDDLAEVEKRITEVEAELAEREDLDARRAEITEQLADRRTKVEQIEAHAVEQFNEHMDAILGLLEYENLQRIWIERRQTEVKEGRRKAIKRVFDLHVIRQSEDGTAYEDTIDHLSESEREVTGLVFALAGYRVHEVHEEVPFMLLDSLEAIDAGRIAALVDYFSEFAPHLVVALLPEDAAALDDSYHRVESI